MTDRAEIIAEAERQADAARSLLENALLRDTLASMEADYLAAFRSSLPDRPQDREAAYYRLMALDHLKSDLRNKLSGGKIAAMNSRHR